MRFRIPPRWFKHSRRLLLAAAALPLLQLGPCQTVVGYTTLTLGRELPALAVNSLASGLFSTFLSVLGLSAQGASLASVVAGR